MTDFNKLVNRTSIELQTHIKMPIDCTIILGSGLSNFVNNVEVSAELSYQDISTLPLVTAPTHKGKILFGKLGNKQVAVCQGRLHLYEGYSAQQITLLSYALHALGSSQLIVTNAAGALNQAYKPGDIMLIDDHINFTGHNPIIGQDDSIGSRFADMSQAYDPDLSDRAWLTAKKLNMPIHKGVYAGVCGPSLETSAERRMFHQLGADAVGMSTIMEVIAARHCSMRVLGLSAITNLAYGGADQKAENIEEILHFADLAGQGIEKIIAGVLSEG